MVKCEECGKEIGEKFIGKIDGTIIKKKENNRIIFSYLCSGCQKEKATLEKAKKK